MQGKLTTNHTPPYGTTGRLTHEYRERNWVSFHYRLRSGPYICQRKEKNKEKAQQELPTRAIACMDPQCSPIDLRVDSSHTLGSTSYDTAP